MNLKNIEKELEIEKDKMLHHRIKSFIRDDNK